MKTDMIYIKKASDFLGPDNSRYFSEGFRSIFYSYGKVEYNESQLCCSLKIKKRSIGKNVDHLGTIEYIAIASNICEQMLEFEYNLTPDEIADAWICKCKLKLRKPVCLERNDSMTVRGEIKKLLKIEDLKNRYKSVCEIFVGDTMIQMEIEHSLQIWMNLYASSPKKIYVSELYSDGYKNRVHKIENINLNVEQKSCSADIRIEDKTRNIKGIGSRYKTTLLTDVVNISGQLAQILLYNLEHIQRKKANNMWLREFSITYPSPVNSLSYEGKIVFDQFDKLKINNECWRSVSLSSYLGYIKADFKIAHKLSE